jgi:diaminopimelate epimerase
MKIGFSKFEGTGNDFIVIDNRTAGLFLSSEVVAKLCDRHFGIGADGLMLLTLAPGYDFSMTYFNSDGRESTMCGNGGRCMIHFARSLGLTGDKARFTAVDGVHEGFFVKEGGSERIRLKMKDVTVQEADEDHVFVDTGSPHYVVFTGNADSMDLIREARKIRFGERFSKEGTNVEFVEIRNDHLYVRSYERGVENETLSCGTGVTASVIAHAHRFPENANPKNVKTPGGLLKVYFRKEGSRFTDIWLEGPVVHVFDGVIEI